MSSEQAAAYVARMRQEGRTDEEVRQALLDSGWEADRIEALLGASAPPAAVGQAPPTVAPSTSRRVPSQPSRAAPRVGGRSRRTGLIVLVAVAAVVAAGCAWFFFLRSPDESKYVGTWLDAGMTTPRSGMTYGTGYVLEADGTGKAWAIIDARNADPLAAERLERDSPDLRQDPPGRYISETDCTWRVDGDRIVICAEVGGSAYEVTHELASDGRSLRMVAAAWGDEDGELQPVEGNASARPLLKQEDP
ncbi:MAG: hypothetical protein PVH68_08925 [Armatimonadota bacterium]|jgi:hypothetical protein